MRTTRLFVLSAALIAAAILTLAYSDARAQQPSPPPLSSTIPIVSPPPRQTPIDEFSWLTFVALNWPAELDAKGRPVRDDAFPMGKPDTSKVFADRGPRVWEGLKADHELFREGAEPTPWNQYDDHLPCGAGEVEDGSGEKILTLVSGGGMSMQQSVNQAMAGPLIDRFGSYVHYEVRHNKLYYDYVRNNKFYLKKELDAKTGWPKKKADFPISVPAENKNGSLEIKAAWRILDPSESEAVANRYYWTWARVPDPKSGKCSPPQRVALVGLHIIHKVEGFNAWLWATFEHVDNVPCNYGPRDNCPPVPDHYSFNARNADLDAKANGNRGYWPKTWQTNPPGGQKWKPFAAEKLPVEPVKEADRINAIRTRTVRDSASEQNFRFHSRPGIAGTFWENYILIDTQWPLDGNGTVKPADPAKPFALADYTTGALDPIPGPNHDSDHPVANVTMETFYQENNPSLPQFGASCMQCHYAAAQRDFSWTLANRAYNPKAAAKPK